MVLLSLGSTEVYRKVSFGAEMINSVRQFRLQAVLLWKQDIKST
jgi:hypothetical protein